MFNFFRKNAYKLGLTEKILGFHVKVIVPPFPCIQNMRIFCKLSYSTFLHSHNLLVEAAGLLTNNFVKEVNTGVDARKDVAMAVD